MTRHALGAALVLVCLAAAHASAAREPACIVGVSTEPAIPVRGQQVLYRARVLRRTDVTSVEWSKPLAFPNLRAEWLPGRAEDTRVELHGEVFLVREEHRALFPSRAGTRQLPEFTLGCRLEDGSTLSVDVPGLVLEVVEPPSAERPESWRGAVGPLHMQLTADPRFIALGESAMLSLSIRGGGNLWVIERPFTNGIPGAEIFRRPEEIDTEPGERLHVRRFFRMDVVPHATGTLEIPAVALTYFDPIANRYAKARTAPVSIQVGPRTGRAATSAAPVSPHHSAEAGLDGRTGPGSVTLLGAAGALTVGLALSWLVVSGYRSRRAAQRRFAPAAEALGAARTAAEHNDAAGEVAALARALEAALACTRTEHAEQLERARALARTLERIRFSQSGEPPDRAAVEAVIEDLRVG